jgi:1-acyl-sn-glycerol-3-phosphate acyltransferase
MESKRSGQGDARVSRGGSRAFAAFSRLAYPFYGKLGLGIKSISFEGAEEYLRLYQEARAGGSRFIVAFRHPGDADPHLVYHALASLSRSAFAKAGARPPAPPRFIAGAEIALWSGPVTRAVLRATRAIMVKHGAPTRASLDEAIGHILARPEPLVIAPEGQVTYSLEGPRSLEEGVMRLAWLARRRSPDPIRIRVLPLSVAYDYGSGSLRERRMLEAGLAALEGIVGIQPRSRAIEPIERLRAIWDRALSQLEDSFSRRYGLRLAPGACLADRHALLVEAALSKLESHFDVRPSGGFERRVIAVRSAMFELRAPARKVGSPLSRAMARTTAEEARALWVHEEFADVAAHLDPRRLDAPLSFNGQAELLQNLWDMVNRIMGGNISTRRRLFGRRVRIIPGKIIECPEGPRDASVSEGMERLLESFRETAASLA